jgi:2-oxoglutarate ferredoxin oxidoreductase subunit alpha
VVLLDGSRLVVESLARAGADVFVGYPITPANLIYSYAMRRLPAVLPAPDEITAVQWMSGFAATGLLPVTATSFPGFALMLETVNMAWMMELPLLVVLAQRLGPATGSATAGAEGDLLLLQGAISGGHPLPVISINSLADCWTMPPLALDLVARLRTPAVLLTSKEMLMTACSFDIDSLPPVELVQRPQPGVESGGDCYAPGPDLVPPFLPLNSRRQVRLNASTHDARGIIQHLAPTALENTARLERKVIINLPRFTRYELDEQPAADAIVVACGVTALAARAAVRQLRAAGRPVSLLLPNTLLPVPEGYLAVLARYQRVVVAEENLSGHLRRVLFGAAGRAGVVGVNQLGRMVAPDEIAAALESDD